VWLKLSGIYDINNSILTAQLTSVINPGSYFISAFYDTTKAKLSLNKAVRGFREEYKIAM